MRINHKIKRMPNNQFDTRFDPELPTVKEYQEQTGCSDFEAFLFGEERIYQVYKEMKTPEMTRMEMVF